MAWVTGKRCTREQSALPQLRRRGSRGGRTGGAQPSRFSFPPSENARTSFALLVSGALGKDGLCSVFFFIANWWTGFSRRENKMLTFSRNVCC